MGRLPAANRKYQLQRLYGVHKEILRRHHLGQKHVEIARSLQITQQMVSYTVNSPLSQAMLKRMDEEGDSIAVDVRERVKEIAPEALELIHDTMDDSEVHVKLRTDLAKDILDRAGYAPPRKIEGVVGHGLFTAEDLMKIRDGASGAKIKEIEAEVITEEAS